MKRAPARWEADNPAAYEQGTRSFWLNAFVSQWASWESIILKYLNAIGSTRKMQVVYNTCFGELWEDRGDLEDEDSLMARREEYPAELPEGVLVLTAGVDTQDDRMESHEIVGHGTLMRPGASRKASSWDDRRRCPYGRSWTSWYLTVFCALRTAWG